jgi:outer membrane lipoprotein LolB
MSASRWRSSALLCLLLGLAACAPVRVRETPAALAAQSAREAQLSVHQAWALSAHVFVGDGDRNSGSGDLEWRQAGDHYDFTLRAPTGKTWKLAGDSQQATLVGVEPQPVHGRDPERLLRERLGWEVPLAGLSDWVRGMRENGPAAALEFDAQGLPAVLEQDGWKIEYRDWFADRMPPLPRKVYATRGKARVKMSIERWSYDE